MFIGPIIQYDFMTISIRRYIDFERVANIIQVLIHSKPMKTNASVVTYAFYNGTTPRGL